MTQEDKEGASVGSRGDNVCWAAGCQQLGRTGHHLAHCSILTPSAQSCWLISNSGENKPQTTQTMKIPSKIPHTRRPNKLVI